MSVARVWEGGSQRPQTAPSRDASLEQRLRDFLRSGGEWERSRTSIPRVFVVKLPGRGSRGPELRKRRGYMVRGRAELEELNQIWTKTRIFRKLINKQIPYSLSGRR